VKKRAKQIFGLAALFLVLVAATFTGATLTAFLTITDVTGSDQTNVVSSIPLSVSGLIDAGLLSGDTQNIQLCDAGTTCQTDGGDTGDETAFSPGTTRTRILSAQRYASSTDTFTDLTTAANDATVDDVIMVASPTAINDAFYFLADHPFRVLWINTGTAGSRAATPWVLSWEYYNGSIYTGVGNVTDNTDAFTTAGFKTVSWDMPDNMATTTVNGSAGYVVRARITDAGTGTITEPLVTQLFYDIGLMWVFTESLPANTALFYDLYLGGPPITRNVSWHGATSSHNMFPGSAGYTVADHPDLEPGIATSTKPWFVVTGYLNASATTEPRYILRKGNDHYIRMSTTTAGTIEVHFSLSVDDCDFSVPGQSSGKSSIYVTFGDGGDVCGYSFASGQTGSADSVAGTFLDNSDPWEFGRDGSFFWIGGFGIIKAGITVSASTTLLFSHVQGARDALTIPDAFGRPYSATSSFPLIASSRTGTIGQFTAASVPSTLTNQNPSGIVVSVASTTAFAADTQIGSGLPGGAFLQNIATDSNIPVAFFWIILASGIVTIAFMSVLFVLKNILYAVIAGGMVMVMFATPQVGVFPIWGVFMYSVMGAVPVIIGRRLGLSA
jgi:hypothetical protein